MAWELEEAISYYARMGAPADQSAVVSLLREVQQQHGGGIDINVLDGASGDTQRHEGDGEGEKKSGNTAQFHNDKFSICWYNGG